MSLGPVTLRDETANAGSRGVGGNGEARGGEHAAHHAGGDGAGHERRVALGHADVLADLRCEWVGSCGLGWGLTLFGRGCEVARRG